MSFRFFEIYYKEKVMRDYKVFKTEIGGKEVSVEIGKYAFQTNGHCVVRCGETVVSMIHTNRVPLLKHLLRQHAWRRANWN